MCLRELGFEKSSLNRISKQVYQKAKSKNISKNFSRTRGKTNFHICFFTALFFFFGANPSLKYLYYSTTLKRSWKGTRQVTKMLPIDVFYLPMTIENNQKANNMQKLWNTRNEDSKQFQRGVKSILHCPATLYCKKVNWISQPEVCSPSCVLSEHSNILTQLQLYRSIKYQNIQFTIIYYHLYSMQELIMERMVLAWSKNPEQKNNNNFEILPGVSLNNITILQKPFIQN